jgi:ComF family protein
MIFFDELLQSLLPTKCPLCSAFPVRPGSIGLCEDCEPRIHGRLRITMTPPSMVRCWTIGDYDGPHGTLVRLCKYGRSLRVADHLGFRLGIALKDVIEVMDIDAIVHVPVPPFRQMRRGFDQSLQLARGVSRVIEVPVLNALVRLDGREQTGRTGAERRSLRMDTFGLRAVSPPERVLVVDDVLTTGATLHSVARVLRNGGTDLVFGAVVASS